MGCHVIWLCPVPMAEIAADLFAEDAELTALHQVSAVQRWLDGTGSRTPVDAVVVDASPAPQFEYEPAVIMEMLVPLIRPRLLVVVVMHDPALGRSAHDALALEMSMMWPAPRPRLAVEEAVYYYAREHDPVAAKRAKSSGLGQRRMWAEIAVRTGRFLSGDLQPEPFDCPAPTQVLVQAMTVVRGTAAPIRFGNEIRRIMILLAYRRLERRGLSEALNYAATTVTTAINRAVRQLRDLGIDDGDSSGFFYLCRLAERHAVWLRSLNERQRLVLPSELPTD